MKTKNKNRIIVIGSLLLGLILGWVFFAGEKVVEETAHTASEHTEETIWTCSMHPQIRQHEPGDCPICGMELIPVQDEMASGDPQAIQMSEYAMKLANVQTIMVGSETATNKIRLNGKVAINETMASVQSTHIPGRIEQLFVNFTGEEVNRGQALARIYSPAMVTAQEELLQAYAIRESNPRLFEAAKQKLLNWRIGENQINSILESGQASEQFTITADVNGIVTEKSVELGDYVERGMPIYEIADLSQVWVLFDIYENDMSRIEAGSTVEFTVASLPGETFEGEVDFIDPIVNPQTRVSTARVIVNNENGKLKPGMFVTGIIENPVEGNASDKITVPTSAVLWTGQRSVVYVKQDVGTFELREVVLGSSLGDSYIILKGLEKGEEIVVNGTFSVDAAAQLAGKPSMMNPERQVAMSNEKTVGERGVQIEIPEPAKTVLNSIVTTYLDLKNSLVSDDFTGAKENVAELEKIIHNLDIPGLNEEATTTWKGYRQRLEKEVGSLSKTSDIESFRNDFVKLSATLIGLVKSFQLVDETLYILHCPMAKHDEGADWLSFSSEIQNPYFGAKMLKCGEVKNTLR